MSAAHWHAIVRRFDEQVASNTLDPVVYDNDVDDEPQDKRYLRVSVGMGETLQLEMGDSFVGVATERTVGQLVVSIFEPRKEGLYEALRVAYDDIKPKFDRLTIDGITYETPSIFNLGKVGKFWQVNVSCPFYYDEVL